jgi:UDP-N-acetylmuramoyl-L-alanyl-D-glutamate--2,6-diaminopimelate ligase
VRRENWHLRFLARTPCGTATIDLPHAGDFNVLNALAAIATGVALGLPLAAIQRGIAATPPIPGRFERVDCGQDFAVLVDYAHKPDALRRVLQSARALTRGRVIAVFGCGGDRDRGKRPLMGEIASRCSDRVIVTSDNPRSEDPDQIIADILAGVPGDRRHAVYVERDRREAIRLALAAARAGDTVVIAGKGHETYQLVGGQRLPFDDRAVVRELLAGRRSGSAL